MSAQVDAGTAGPIDVVIEVGVGHVELVASDDLRVRGAVTPSSAVRSGDVALARDASAAFRDGVLRIAVPRRMNLFGRTDSVEVRAEVPAGSTVRIDSAYGSVRLRGTFGDARIAAKYGAVTIDRVGDLDLTAPYGEVEVAAVRGRLDLVAGHGHARIERVGGTSRVKASHGSVELGTAVGSVEASLAGALTIDRALTDVTARSAYGRIRIREVTSGVVRLENGYADVEVGIPAGVAAWVDASSAHGSVRNELEPGGDAGPAPGAGSVQLHLSTNWADVVLRRAPATTAPRPSEAGAS
ncbi:MAG TPA: hypothetical protein VGO26_09645 [Amnibacterium sp.]|nr:hypothetical protein [Amnibacterium sp.]